MKKIFLGKLVHWVVLIALVGLGWITGSFKSHVIHFNTFICLLILTTIAIVLLVIKSTDPDEQVTRDPILLDDDD